MLTDDVMAVLKECRTIAMNQALDARVPECGHFGAIAQDLDWAIGQLSAAPAARPEITDEQCDAIYNALDLWAQAFDPRIFGLPEHCGDGVVGGRAVIRAALGIKDQP